MAAFQQAARQIRAGMAAATSIDGYLDAHHLDNCVNLVGKLAIVLSILEAESSGVDGKLGSGARSATPDLKAFGGTWLPRFFKLLSANIPREDINSIFDRAAVVSFNYDRSFECFLTIFIQSFYAVSSQEAEDVMRKLTIIHPYGTVGPWFSSNRHPFGMNVAVPDRLLNLAQGIRTYTESSAEVMTLQELVRRAEVIVFLGFRYISDNMALLGPVDGRLCRRIFGTAAGRSNSDKAMIDAQLAGFLAPKTGYYMPDHKTARIDLFSGTCSDLFDNFPLAMTAAV
jgi:hypothetical protein